VEVYHLPLNTARPVTYLKALVPFPITMTPRKHKHPLHKIGNANTGVDYHDSYYVLPLSRPIVGNDDSCDLVSWFFG